VSWVTHILKELKSEPIIAENGEEAIQIYKQSMREGISFEFILMDIIMPVMNGFDSSKGIR